MSTILFLVIGYLCGSIPFGLLLTKAAGLGDVRSIGSGNIGATNVLRTGNKKIAALTLLCDTDVCPRCSEPGSSRICARCCSEAPPFGRARAPDLTSGNSRKTSVIAKARCTARNGNASGGATAIA